jgi:hypothetical protein
MRRVPVPPMPMPMTTTMWLSWQTYQRSQIQLTMGQQMLLRASDYQPAYSKRMLIRLVV